MVSVWSVRAPVCVHVYFCIFVHAFCVCVCLCISFLCAFLVCVECVW